MALGIDRAGARGFLMGDAKEVVGHAAGTIHVAPDGAILLLYRSPLEQNFAGHWALPGGKVEPGESVEAGADRETSEETGFYSEVPKKLLHQVVTPNKMAFHTFVRPVSERFAPSLNDEHTGYVWASLGMLPEPLHPSLKECLQKIPGSAELLQWASEADPEPMAQDEAFDVLAGEIAGMIAQDQALLGMDRAPEGLELDRHGVAVKMAFDRAATESKQGRSDDRFDRLHVKRAPITKACISPYYGREIPKGKQLGLDPNKIYMLLRDPEELKKAAPTFQNLPLLSKHVPHTADAHDGDITVGTVGSNVEYQHPYLFNSLAVWSREGREYAEGDQKELSSAYHYDADMTPGEFEGEPYDGVMRNMVGNHVCLVKKGRAGSDVALDEALQTPRGESEMSKKFRSMKASVAAGAVRAYLQPHLAMDAAPPNVGAALRAFEPKKFGEGKKKFLTALGKVLPGKLAQDSAVSGVLAGVGKIMESIEGNDAVSDEPVAEGEPELVDEADAMDGGLDAIKAYLKEKGVPDDIIAGMPTGETEVEVEPEADPAPAPAPKKEEVVAKDGPTDDMEARLAEGGKEKVLAKDNNPKGLDGKDDDKVTVGAMDAAIEKARTDTMATMRGIESAKKHVRPIVGELDMAFDSAEGVYRHAFKMHGKEVPKAVTGEAALKAMWDLLPAPGRRTETVIAQDSASVKSFAERFPNAAKVKRA